MSLKLLAAVFGAGGLGAVTRYGLNAAAAKLGVFPYGTLAANLIGCFLFGLAYQAAEIWRLPPGPWRAAIFAGFLGGFTTFSSFIFDTYNLSSNKVYLGIFNILIHIIGGYLLFIIGIMISKYIFKS
ncbi:MAG: CrcB family protein [Deltaproteobacteria bacterium]|nr:CrcB family protein [Deltaproteobacteria bacterium]